MEVSELQYRNKSREAAAEKQRNFTQAINFEWQNKQYFMKIESGGTEILEGIQGFNLFRAQIYYEKITVDVSIVSFSINSDSRLKFMNLSMFQLLRSDGCQTFLGYRNYSGPLPFKTEFSNLEPSKDYEFCIIGDFFPGDDSAYDIRIKRAKNCTQFTTPLPHKSSPLIFIIIAIFSLIIPLCLILVIIFVAKNTTLKFNLITRLRKSKITFRQGQGKFKWPFTDWNQRIRNILKNRFKAKTQNQVPKILVHFDSKSDKNEESKILEEGKTDEEENEKPEEAKLLSGSLRGENNTKNFDAGIEISKFSASSPPSTIALVMNRENSNQTNSSKTTTSANETPNSPSASKNRLKIEVVIEDERESISESAKDELFYPQNQIDKNNCQNSADIDIKTKRKLKQNQKSNKGIEKTRDNQCIKTGSKKNFRLSSSPNEHRSKIPRSRPHSTIIIENQHNFHNSDANSSQEIRDRANTYSGCEFDFPEPEKIIDKENHSDQKRSVPDPFVDSNLKSESEPNSPCNSISNSPRKSKEKSKSQTTENLSDLTLCNQSAAQILQTDSPNCFAKFPHARKIFPKKQKYNTLPKLRMPALVSTEALKQDSAEQVWILRTSKL